MNQHIIVDFIAYALTVAAVTAVQHMAFRGPQWKERELTRRAIGVGTVLGLFALFMLRRGVADILTWVMIVGGFVIAGAIKAGSSWYDKTQRTALMGQFYERIEGRRGEGRRDDAAGQD